MFSLLRYLFAPWAFDRIAPLALFGVPETVYLKMANDIPSAITAAFSRLKGYLPVLFSHQEGSTVRSLSGVDNGNTERTHQER